MILQEMYEYTDLIMQHTHTHIYISKLYIYQKTTLPCKQVFYYLMFWQVRRDSSHSQLKLEPGHRFVKDIPRFQFFCKLAGYRQHGSAGGSFYFSERVTTNKHIHKAIT